MALVQLKVIRDMDENQALTELPDDSIVDSINKKLEALSSLSKDCCIYKVPERLRKLNPDAYSPRIVSIGPFHHRNDELQAMEDHKLRYLKCLIPKTSLSLERVIEVAKTWEEKARFCYAEEIDLSSNEFVKMLIVDAGFLVELLLRSPYDVDDSMLDRIYGKQKMIVDVNHDIMLLENQLPYFVVKEMFALLKGGHGRGLPLSPTVHGHFKKYWMSIPTFSTNISDSEPHHFVDLLRSIHLPLVLNSPGESKKMMDSTLSTKVIRNGVKLKPSDSSTPPLNITFTDGVVTNSSGESRKMMDSTLSTKVIRNAGVKLKPADISTPPLDITFADGVLTIPQIKISDITEALYRNIILFEQCHRSKAYFSDYMMFLSSFVRSPVDAELFIDRGIIVNRRGNAEHISRLFDRVLRETTQTSYSTFYYQTVYDNLKAHCNKPRNKWHTTLRRDYFHNPWSIASVVAAVVLLILTFLQALCSFLAL